MRRKSWSAELNRRRAEDLEWMAATGENAVGAAERLGISLAALERWGRRNRPDLWATLSARNPRDPNYRNHGKNQWTAA